MKVTRACLAIVAAVSTHGASAADEIDQRNAAIAFMDAVAFSSGKRLPYYRTHSLHDKDTAIDTVLIIIPGGINNGPKYFAAGLDAARQAGRSASTAVMALQFQTAEENPRRDELYWTGAWQQGADSLDGSRTSSFSVLDEVLTRAVGSFPAATSVVLAGHSSGGQIINRYAATGGDIADHDKITFVVMNPSTYVYIDDRRARADGSFAPPGDAAQTCPRYDHWKYGLVDPQPYVQALTPAEVRSRMMRRNVVYLGGGADDKTGGGVDARCPAMYQGRTRLERTLTYWRYIQTFPEWRANARLAIARGIGHSGGGMIRSKEFGEIVFGRGD